MARRRFRVRTIALYALSAIGLCLLAAFGVLLAIHQREVRRVDALWRSVKHAPLGDIGSTRTLTIIPLLDWHASRGDLATEMGVSYLIKTDHLTVLFDTGNNTGDTDPSPLERNMAALRIALDQIDAIVISHAHFDHVGGRRYTGGAVSGSTFGVGNQQPDLSGKRILVPIDMTYPGSRPQTTSAPLRLADGIATTGTIRRKLLGGTIDEQALAVNVEGKGIVLIVGCGHQTLTRLLERTEAVFNAPLYGVVGGLHYPVPDGRLNVAGINIQRRFASGGGPLSPLTRDDVDAELALLESRHIGLLAIGGHDSSDEVIESARARFGKAHRHVRVGEPITVGPSADDDESRSQSKQGVGAQ